MPIVTSTPRSSSGLEHARSKLSIGTSLARDVTHSKRYLESLGLLGLVVAGVILFTPLPVVLERSLRTQARLESAEALVVLASSISLDGVLSDASLRRTVRGIELYRDGLAPLLVLSGQLLASGQDEADARARLVRRLGIPSEVILTMSGAHTTREEAERAAALLHPRGIRRILLVSDGIHLRRATRHFERAGFESLPAPVDYFQSAAGTPESRLTLMRDMLDALLAELYARWPGP
jgi:uncharacterized SAM-binding protein YcdF (DUF218 family)